MKKMMMIAAMMVATLTASAQNSVFEPGTFTLQPKVGIGFTEISHDDAKFKFGIGGGVDAQYQINDWFGVSAGVMYQQQGTKIKDVDDVKLNLDYLNIPVMAKFYVVRGLSLNVGLQPGFLMSAKVKYDGGDTDIKDFCNTVDLSVPVSIAYEFPMGLTLEARYTTGLTNVGKDAFDEHDSSWDKTYQNKNEVFMLTIGYKFGL